MPTTGWEPETVFDLIGDRVARQILLVASGTAVTADELATQLGVSLPSIYRRVNELNRYDLLSEELQVADDGNHYKTFRTELDRLLLNMSDGTLTAIPQLKQRNDERFGAFWQNIGGTIDPSVVGSSMAPDGHTSSPDQPNR